jgi:tetratricopeptide (TPR) repeat protein
MKEKKMTKSVNVTVGGDVSGQIVVGNHNLVIGGVYGGVVNLITPGKQPTFTPHPKPVYLRPRAFPGLLDREAEQKTAVNTLQMPESLSISGEDGIGKTALMRYLAYNSPGDNFPDGIIYLSAQGYSMEDLRQYIFESFFESDIALKPTEAKLSHSLQELRALILLDDLSLNYAEVTQLINSISQSNFIFGSSSRCLWGEGNCIELGGLPIKESLTLLERELGRALNEQEKLIAEEFCREVNGNPLTVLQAAGLLRQRVAFSEMLVRLRMPKEQFVKDILSGLSASQRQVMFLLAVSNGQPIPAKHLAVLCQDKDLDTTLNKLIELNLIQSHSPAYSLRGTLAFSIGKFTDLDNWEERLLNYFVGWIKQNPPLPEITDVLNLTLTLLEKANREHRWDDVITLGRGIEKALCMVKRWEAWLHVLEWILNATRELGNRSLQGWALHQLGTRELCLGNLETAKKTLTQALDIRHALGDKSAATVTQHNLDLIIAPPTPPRDTPRSGPKPAPKGGGSSILKVLFMLTVMAAVVVAIVIIFGPSWVKPSDTHEAVPIATTKAPSEVHPTTKKTPTQRPPTQKPPTKKPPTITPTPTLTSTPCRFGIWYCEDFEDKNALNWELSPAWHIQPDGSNYLLEGSGHEWASLTEHEWRNFRVRFNLRLFGGTIHLNYRILPDPGYGITRYYFGVSEKYVYLQKSLHGGGWEDLDSTDNYISLGDWHTIEIAGWDGHVVIYIDGSLIMQYYDEEYLPSGSIAFETLDNSNAQVDNIEVMESGEEPSSGIGTIYIITPIILPVTCTSTYMTSEENTDRPGMDYWSDIYSDPIDYVLFTAATCQEKCYNDPACMAFTYDDNLRQCWLKSGVPNAAYKAGDTSGIRVCK